ncbi:hypothetical protein PQX77_017682 [Marasmius sp. AFHP31]|nr:hypothetical protein PQX77_017682 [Marasmius sp. AFHP31]
MSRDSAANATAVGSHQADASNHRTGILSPHCRCAMCVYHFGHGSAHAFNPSLIPFEYPAFSPYPPPPTSTKPHPPFDNYPASKPAQDLDQRHISTSQQRTAESTDHLDNPDIFKTVDEAITDHQYWCNYGPAKLAKTDDLVRDWDRSPQGHYHAHVPWTVAAKLDDFNVDWSTRTHTTKHSKLTTGKVSETIGSGYRVVRHCLGFLECANPDCARITRAHSTLPLIAKQAGTLCKCSHPSDPEKQFLLTHVPCANKSTIIKYAGGIWYCNGEAHDHDRIPRSLHLSRKQKQQLQSLVVANPGAPPAALRAGKTVSGESSLDISDRFGNSKAARYEIDKIRPPRPASGDDFIARYVQFLREHPNVVILNTLSQGDPVVISIQTPFMADQLARASKNKDGFNGLITDAGQKWFASRQSCLITTSVISPTLSVWVPAVYSYANGESEPYYECHFLAVFRSLRTVKHSRGEEVTDIDLGCQPAPPAGPNSWV